MNKGILVPTLRWRLFDGIIVERRQCTGMKVNWREHIAMLLYFSPIAEKEEILLSITG